MRPNPTRRASAGFTYVEVTAAFTILVIGVLGFAGTVIYTRNLDRSTARLWKANVAATGALEDVREDASNQWQSIDTLWDGHTVVADGAANATDGTIRTTVVNDPSLMDASDGMWTSGHSLPNYFHVAVTSNSDENDLAKSINYQTYVADRTGFRSLVADPYVGPPQASTDAERIDVAPRNVTVSGATNDKVNFQLMNGSPAVLQLKSLYVSFGNGGRFVRVAFNGTQLYNDPSKPRSSRTLKPGSGRLDVNPGLIDFAIVGLPRAGCGPHAALEPIIGQTIKVRLEFKDKSKTEFQVHP